MAKLPVVSLFLLLVPCLWARDLQTTREGKFKVIQFADLHFGENEEGPWGPEQDRKSLRAMDRLLEAEKPDFIVFSGDQLTGNNIHDNATVYWGQIVSIAQKWGVPWASIFGNHDTAPLEKRSTTSRKELMSFDRSFNLSYSQHGPDSIHGVSNYLLYLRHQGHIVAALYFLDTGGGTYPEILYKDQVDWVRESTKQWIEDYPNAFSLAFLHIPIKEYIDAWNNGKECDGLHEDGVAATEDDSDVFDAFSSIPNFRTIIVGHNHGNNWCCLHQSIYLCYGSHTGYGGYGNWDRGARVIEFEVKKSNIKQPLNVHTWIRLENGKVVNFKDITPVNSFD